MRLEKIKENEEVNLSRLLDYIDCGDFYLLTVLCNPKIPAITLNQNTVLEDLHKKHGGDLSYSKLCKNTFRMYESENGEFYSHNIDEVSDWKKINIKEYYDRLLKALITGVGLGDLEITKRIVRWSNENGGRGEHWYRLLRN
ncbi:MAG: hypothetical protein EB127_27970 [Alphaproteobacteria bacterium]|nr:hypothetical protein [Alphaproteobacteria bacterium]